MSELDISEIVKLFSKNNNRLDKINRSLDYLCMVGLCILSIMLIKLYKGC